MNDKDLIAQNLEEKNEITDAVPTPAKKRTTRKKTASQTDTSAEITTAESEHNLEAVPDATDNTVTKNTDITPVFSISSSDFSPEYVPDESTNDEENHQETKEECDVDSIILPPDELFSTAEKNGKAELESEPEQTDTEIDSSRYEDEMDDADQYTLLDIEPVKTEFGEQNKNEKAQKQYDPLKPRRIDRWFDLSELIVFTLLAVMIVTSFFFRHSIVDGESMENTLHSGEHLIISDIFYTPKRGDIIVCEDYTTAIPKPIVKRVIAIEGDTVKITSNGEIYVNRILLEESSYVHIDDLGYHYRDLEITVPKDELFVMGDHRNKSTDSREIGTVSEDSVLGKVLLRFYPFNKFGKVD